MFGKLSLKQKQKKLDDFDRVEGKHSLYYFNRHIIGYDLVPNTHWEFCDLIGDHGIKLRLLLMPRGSFKTSVLQGYVCQRLIQDPNLRILLDSEVLSNSINNLGVVKRIFESHTRFKELYGDYFNPKAWTQDSITINQRTNIKLKEPSVNTSSIETVQVGPHYDEIICDDLHSEHNSKTKDQVDIVKNHIRLLFSLLDPGKTLTILGTRWSDFDAYGDLIESGEFKVIIKAAHNPDGSLFFPERLTEKFLAAQKKRQGIEIYNAQYNNNPVPDQEHAAFKKSNFRYFLDPPPSLDYYIAADPALPGDDTHDYFAIVVAGISRMNEIYFTDMKYGHWTPWEAINIMFYYADKYSKLTLLKGIGIETNLFQRLLKFQFTAEMRKRNKFYRVIEVKHYTESKDERILALQPRYECGAIFHRESMRGGEAEEELLKFPKGKKRDVADAMATILEIANLRSIRKRHPKIPPQTIDEVIKWHMKQKIIDRRMDAKASPLGRYW